MTEEEEDITEAERKVSRRWEESAVWNVVKVA